MMRSIAGEVLTDAARRSGVSKYFQAMAIGIAEVNRKGLTLCAGAYARTTHVSFVPGAVSEGNTSILDGLEGPIEMGAVQGEGVMNAWVRDLVKALQVQSEGIVEPDNGEMVIHACLSVVLSAQYPSIKLNRLVLVFHRNYRVVQRCCHGVTSSFSLGAAVP